MSDLLEEIQSDIKDEKFLYLFKKYAKFAVAIAVLIILATIFFNYLNQSKISKQENLSNIYYKAQTAIKNNNLIESKILLNKVINANNPNYSPFAAIELSHIHYELSEHKLAEETLNKIIQNKAYNDILRDLAEITLISYNNKDSLAADVNKLKVLAKDNSPWEFSAKMLLAEKLMLLDKNSAIRILYELQDNSKTPQTMLPIIKILIQNNKQNNPIQAETK